MVYSYVKRVNMIWLLIGAVFGMLIPVEYVGSAWNKVKGLISLARDKLKNKKQV